MNPTDLTNSATDKFFYPADYGAETQLEIMRPADRQALRDRLSELLALPREQWPDHGVIDLSHHQPGKFAVFFGADGIAWVIPEADGRFRVDGLGSQKTLREFQRQVDEGEDEAQEQDE